MSYNCFLSVQTWTWHILITISAGFCMSGQIPATSWREIIFGNSWNNVPTQREPKFLPIFAIGAIGLGACTAPTGEEGTCMTNKDCILRNGIPGGPCTGGYTICCVFLVTCDGIIRENTTYFVNPNHPDIYDRSGNCQISIPKIHPEICQFRLDFDLFTIAPPESTNHLCNQDQLVVSGGSVTPTICGNSAGDHMYVDAGLGQSNPIVMSLITNGPFPRLWRIRITQILCGRISRADQNCLQYYTGISGRVRSFNYNTVSGRQLSNQDYSICIRTEHNFCGIQYTACADIENNRSRAFTISGNSNSAVTTMVGGGTTNTQNSCINDWLLIGCIRNADRRPPLTACEDRVCGGLFGAEVGNTAHPVQSNVRPFRLYFHSDGIESPTDIDNRGFCLDYVQQPCTTYV